MKIIIHRSKCISCGSCVTLCPDFFELGQDGLANLKNAKALPNGDFELEIGETSCIKDAAEACPMQVISIEE